MGVSESVATRRQNYPVFWDGSGKLLCVLYRGLEAQLLEVDSAGEIRYSFSDTAENVLGDLLKPGVGSATATFTLNALQEALEAYDALQKLGTARNATEKEVEDTLRRKIQKAQTTLKNLYAIVSERMSAQKAGK